MNKVINDKLEYSKPLIGIVSAKFDTILQTGSGQHNREFNKQVQIYLISS